MCLAAYMSSPCHIELVLSEKETTVKKEVRSHCFRIHLQRLRVDNSLDTSRMGQLLLLAISPPLAAVCRKETCQDWKKRSQTIPPRTPLSARYSKLASGVEGSRC